MGIDVDCRCRSKHAINKCPCLWTNKENRDFHKTWRKRLTLKWSSLNVLHSLYLATGIPYNSNGSRQGENLGHQCACKTDTYILCKTEARFVWPLWTQGRKENISFMSFMLTFGNTDVTLSFQRIRMCILRQLGWVEGIEECINLLEIIMIYEVLIDGII